MRVYRVNRFEDYLRVMYMLQTDKGFIRVKDLAKLLNIKPASVVEFLEKLSSKKYVVYEKYNFIKLTDKGLKKGEELYLKHEMIKSFLMLLLDISDETAEKDACYIEHGLHKKTLEHIVLFIEFAKNCPKGMPDWLQHLKYYYKHREYPEECTAGNENRR